MRTYRELVGEAERRGDKLARVLVESGAPLSMDDAPISDLLTEADALPDWTPGDAASDVRAVFRNNLENSYGDLLFA